MTEHPGEQMEPTKTKHILHRRRSSHYCHKALELLEESKRTNLGRFICEELHA